MQMTDPAHWVQVIALVAFAVFSVATGLVRPAEAVFANLAAVTMRTALNARVRKPLLLEGMSHAGAISSSEDANNGAETQAADAAVSDAASGTTKLDAGHELSLDDLELPGRTNLIHFAYPVVIGGNEIGKAGETVIEDYVKGKGAFKVVTEAPTQRWSGPESSVILANDAVSIFVTISRLRSQDIRQTLSLVLLKASAAATVSSNTEKNVELRFEKDEDGVAFVVGAYGDDAARVRLEDTTGSRTFWMTRGSKYLNVGYFDTFSDASGAERAECSDTVKALTSQPVQINADGSTLEAITSLVIYGADMNPEMHAVKAGIQRHAMHHNDLYANLFADQKRLKDSVNLARVTPRYTGAEVREACKEVEDWTMFDPVKVSCGCRDAIRNSCIADPSQDGCECWRKDEQVYNGTVCEATRLLYGAMQEAREEPTEDALKPPSIQPEELAQASYLKPPSLWTWLTPV
jgi:hypothetical protein